MNSAQRVYQANTKRLMADSNQAYIDTDQKQEKLSNVQEQLEVKTTHISSKLLARKSSSVVYAT